VLYSNQPREPVPAGHRSDRRRRSGSVIYNNHLEYVRHRLSSSALRHLFNDAGRSRVGTTTDTSGAYEALRGSFDGTRVSRTELE
jgi:hypothetical protein